MRFEGKKSAPMPSPLYLHNTMTRRKEEFIPLQGDRTVKMFSCGPSIYAFPHVGNYRTFLFEDILQRYLEYLGYRVERLLNFTDVEDKSIREASKKGISLDTLTRPVADRFFSDCELLRIKLNPPIPRSSTSIGQAVSLIERLLEKGYAYRYGRDVYYDPLKFEGFGKLYGLDMRNWPKKRFRFSKDTYPGRRWNFGDFILWKGRREFDGSVFWNTSLGEGRPSWNVQDPAMIAKHLGYRIDISCGGVDNLYRHHDYNIAVIEGVSGENFANYWLHGELVLVDGVKMSKSRGNIVYIQDLLDRGYAPHHLRFCLIYGHYRRKLSLAEDKLHLARGKIDSFRALAGRLCRDFPTAEPVKRRLDDPIPDLKGAFEARMNDDLDVKGAFDAVYAIVSELAVRKARGGIGLVEYRQLAADLRQIDTVLRVFE